MYVDYKEILETILLFFLVLAIFFGAYYIETQNIVDEINFKYQTTYSVWKVMCNGNLYNECLKLRIK